MTTLHVAATLSPDTAAIVRQQASLLLRAAALWRRHAFAALAPLHLMAIVGVSGALVWLLLAVAPSGLPTGAAAVIGIQGFVGTRAVIGAGVVIPPAGILPARTVPRTQDDVRAFLGQAAARRA